MAAIIVGVLILAAVIVKLTAHHPDPVAFKPRGGPGTGGASRRATAQRTRSAYGTCGVDAATRGSASLHGHR